jgi:hypothetical protein
MSASSYKRIFANNQQSTYNDGCDHEITRFSLLENTTDTYNQIKSDLLYSGNSPINANNYFDTVTNIDVVLEQVKNVTVGIITGVSTSTGSYGRHIGISTTIGISGQNGPNAVVAVTGTTNAIRQANSGNNSPFEYTTNKGVTWTSSSTTVGYYLYEWTNNRLDKVATISNASQPTMVATFGGGGISATTSYSESHTALAGGISNDLLLMGKSNQIYRSTTWTPPGTLVATITGSPITMAISSGSVTTATCIAITSGGLLYRSADGGQNWSQVSSTNLPKFLGLGYRSCVWHPVTSKFYFLNTIDNKSTIFSSSDGQDWEMISQTYFNGSAAFSTLYSEHNYLVATGGVRAWRSFDGYQWCDILGGSVQFWQRLLGVSYYTHFDGTGYYAEGGNGGNGRSIEYGSFGSYVELSTYDNENYSSLILPQQVKRSDSTGSPPSIRGSVNLIDNTNKKIYLQDSVGTWTSDFSGKSAITSEGFSQDEYVGINVGRCYSTRNYFGNFTGSILKTTSTTDLSSFTYDLFFKLDSASSTNQAIIDTRNSENNTGFYFGVNESSVLKIHSASGISSTAILSPIDTDWHHIRITPSTSYIDNNIISHGFSVSSGSRISISSNSSNTDYMVGKISNFRLVQKTLSSPGSNYFKNLLSTATKSYPSINEVNY